MKRIFDFVYCDTQLHPNVVWYLVRVGMSARDRKAFAVVRQASLSTTDILFAQHNQELADFQAKVALSLFPEAGSPSCPPVGRLRRVMIDVTTLAASLRSYPLAFLNASVKSLPLTANEKKPKLSC